MKISEHGINLIKSFEGFRSHPYRDAVGVCTIGYGTTHYSGGSHVKCSDPMITEELATSILEDEINNHYAKKVDHYLQVPVSQNEFDALVSLAYNIGVNAFRTSTLLRDVNAGKLEAAQREFLRWTYGNGRRLAGLVHRRKKEAELFLA